MESLLVKCGKTSKYLPVQGQLKKHLKNVWDMFKVKNKDTKTTFWYIYC